MSEPTSRAWLKPFREPLKPIFREILALSFFVNLLALGVPVFTLQVYDRVVAHAGISTLWGLGIGMLLVLIFDFILRMSRSKIMQTVALRIDVEVGQKLFGKFMRLPLQMLEGQPATYWTTIFRDVDTVRNTVSGASAVLVADLLFFPLFLGLIMVIAAPISWVILIMLPVFGFVAYRSGMVVAASQGAERQTSTTRDGLIGEIINGRTTVKALALDGAMRPLWEELQADNIKNAIDRGGKTDFFSNLTQSLSMVTTIAMTTVGAIMIINQEMTMGALIASNMLAGRMIGPVVQAVNQWRTFIGFRQAVDRLGEIFNAEGERETSDIKLDDPKGEVTVENVSFAYNPEGKPTVDSVTIKLAAGGIHALVGRNGSGKTTLLKIIQGLYKPHNGRILLDGADISQFTRAELAVWMGYVPQDCILFAGTVRDNIAHRVPSASDEEIIEAAKAAGVHHFIIDMPDGYATEIGEAGRRLSGGQRQRIAIARALVGQPALLLLDEPSSSLDRQAEIELRATLVKIAREHTVIIVTHSPILLAACDNLVALDQGKVALAGPAKEILPRLFGQGGPKPMDKGAVALAAPSGGAPAQPQAPAAPQPEGAGRLGRLPMSGPARTAAGRAGRTGEGMERRMMSTEASGSFRGTPGSGLSKLQALGSHRAGPREEIEGGPRSIGGGIGDNAKDADKGRKSKPKEPVDSD